MRVRIILGSSMLLLLALLFFLDHSLETTNFIAGTIVLIGLAGWLEMAGMFGITGGAASGGSRWRNPLFWVGLCGTAYFLAFAWWDGREQTMRAAPLALGVAGLLFTLFVSMLWRSDHEQALRGLVMTLLGVLLCGFLFSFLLRIYDRPNGFFLAVFFVLGAKGNDIVAYFVGRALGRHTFLKVSPKKTLEGCGGAVAFSVLWFLGAHVLWPDIFFGWPWQILLGIIFSVATQLGDLAESLLKRACGVKDSARLLPEFGGVLDLIDSTLFSGVFFWSVIERAFW